MCVRIFIRRNIITFDNFNALVAEALVAAVAVLVAVSPVAAVSLVAAVTLVTTP